MTTTHFARLDRVMYNLEEYDRYVSDFARHWNLLGDGVFPKKWSEQHMIDAWENDLKTALIAEKAAIHFANQLRRDLEVML